MNWKIVLFDCLPHAPIFDPFLSLVAFEVNDPHLDSHTKTRQRRLIPFLPSFIVFSPKKGLSFILRGNMNSESTLNKGYISALGVRFSSEYFAFCLVHSLGIKLTP